MNNDIILPVDSVIYQSFENALDKRAVFFTGLSGVGKSLYIQQFSKMAANAGRVVHLLQWDVTREAFQTKDIMAKYPEINGVTHPMIRKAVGLWTRKGILNWHKEYSDEKHILVGELPLIGNRLVEVVQQHDDEVEALLASEQSQFFLPVPSKSVRAHIVSCRTNSINQPNHERESSDAPPSVVDSMWQEVRELSKRLINSEDKEQDENYDPHAYESVFEYLLQHRHATTLRVDQVLPTVGSVYDLDVIATEIAATEQQVTDVFTEIEAKYTEEDINKMINNWHEM
ncbi:hypothetical protein ACPUVO_13710 [Pseudocolwellia sp. HL-MZ19]|uniref:hypothetical protein n=1 Tax=Pseudocolwellia sp. HL-MZ19 TaxID=3400846 RepID=UPI003CEF07BB